MKKVLFINLLVLSMALSAQAIECKEGSVLKAKNGTEYCKSNDEMTWQEASAWCAAQKMGLVSWENLCPGSHFAKHCDNLDGVGENSVWTSTSYDNDRALRISLSCGCTNRHTHIRKHLAICK